MCKAIDETSAVSTFFDCVEEFQDIWTKKVRSYEPVQLNYSKQQIHTFSASRKEYYGAKVVFHGLRKLFHNHNRSLFKTLNYYKNHATPEKSNASQLKLIALIAIISGFNT